MKDSHSIWRPLPGNKIVNYKHNYGSHHGTNQTSTFTEVIPSDGLT